MKPALYILLIGLCIACGKKGEDHAKIPPGILSKEEFSALLVDLSLAESASSLNPKGAAIHKLDSVYAFDPLAEHKISKGQYDSTLLFYAQHPEIYRSVYDSVLVKLSELKVQRSRIKASQAPK